MQIAFGIFAAANIHLSERPALFVHFRENTRYIGGNRTTPSSANFVILITLLSNTVVFQDVMFFFSFMQCTYQLYISIVRTQRASLRFKMLARYSPQNGKASYDAPFYDARASALFMHEYVSRLQK